MIRQLVSERILECVPILKYRYVQSEMERGLGTRIIQPEFMFDGNVYWWVHHLRHDVIHQSVFAM